MGKVIAGAGCAGFGCAGAAFDFAGAVVVFAASKSAGVFRTGAAAWACFRCVSIGVRLGGVIARQRSHPPTTSAVTRTRAPVILILNGDNRLKGDNRCAATLAKAASRAEEPVGCSSLRCVLMMPARERLSASNIVITSEPGNGGVSLWRRVAANSVAGD